ncbi:MAG: cytochrome c biogenesis protein CcsA [Candidatus Omnitrophica bacterium]|nr:cytochrome c biogenesis protein CcsA [Candidatus Omnitrophota bacterium]
MIALHAAVLFASYAAFFVAVVTGVLFLVQERRLKRKDPRVLQAVLPLELLDRVNLWSVLVGFALFSFGMIQGFLLARTRWGAFWTGDPKEVWSLATLAAYAAVLGFRASVGLRGRRIVFLSVVSFLLVLFTFVGVNYFIGGRHVFF